MPRGYPRFFLSHVEHGNTPGTFIIHALEPFLIMRLYEGEEHEDYNGSLYHHESFGGFTLELITRESTLTGWNNNEVIDAFRAAGQWYKYLPKDS